jgi:prolyl-tRNA editing enzyme YbaK/EbsC (Cys-tRNA(Pro) deacylase)
MTDLPPATQRFVALATEAGLDVAPMVFPEGTKTSADAAQAAGCELTAIAKSIVMMAGDEPVVVIISGDKRVDQKRLEGATGRSPVRRASLDEARHHTGWAAGGTPAFGYANPVEVLADRSLQRHDEVWSAAGTPTTIYPVPLDQLVRVSQARWVDVAQEETTT